MRWTWKGKRGALHLCVGRGGCLCVVRLGPNSRVLLSGKIPVESMCPLGPIFSSTQKTRVSISRGVRVLGFESPSMPRGGGVLKKRSDWVGSVLRISLRVPSLSARRVPLPRGIPWVARVASPGSLWPGSQPDQSWGAPVLGAASRVSGVAILPLLCLVRAGQLSLFGAPSQG